MSKKDASDDDDLLLETLMCLEDMLFESVSLKSGDGLNDDDDDELEQWNVPSSKYGEKFRSELRNFEERALEAFERGTSSSSSLAPGGGRDEFTLEQGDLHREFVQLLESSLESFLHSRGSNVQQLIHELKLATHTPSSSSSSTSTQTLEVGCGQGNNFTPL
jgi:hypothetical protein